MCKPWNGWNQPYSISFSIWMLEKDRQFCRFYKYPCVALSYSRAVSSDSYNLRCIIYQFHVIRWDMKDMKKQCFISICNNSLSNIQHPMDVVASFTSNSWGNSNGWKHTYSPLYHTFVVHTRHFHILYFLQLKFDILNSSVRGKCVKLMYFCLCLAMQQGISCY